MYLKYIKINNFRNISSIFFKPNERFNVFIGKNAQGKTNLLEAVVCLSDGRSFRKNHVADLIKDGKTFAIIEGIVKSWDSEKELKILFEAGGRKYWVNGKETKDLKLYLGHVNFIIFSADQIKIIEGEPKDRRDYIDRIIFMNYPHYLFTIRDYKKLIKMKNNMLKTDSFDPGLLEILNDQISSIGARIISRRLSIIDELEKLARNFYKNLTAENGEMSINYVCAFDIDEAKKDEKTIKGKFNHSMNKIMKRESERKMCLIGPHRDDLEICLNGRKMRIYCSRGQKRSAIIALKIAEFVYFKKKRGEIPVLVLDDVISELDDEKRKNILKFIPENAQVFWSQNDLIQEELMQESLVFKVERGNIQEFKSVWG